MGENDTDVEVVDRRLGFQGFFKVTVNHLRHRRFDGEFGPVLTREIFERPPAVAVLPYDPVADKVLLIRQFLPGAHFAGRPSRPLQIVAGMIDAGETEEDAIRREAIEEADLRIVRLERIASYLPSPGGSDERVTVFLAVADLSGAGGVHGLASEGEDIKVEVMDATEALRRLERGEIESAPAVVALLWFAANRGRLRAV